VPKRIIHRSSAEDDQPQFALGESRAAYRHQAGDIGDLVEARLFFLAQPRKALDDREAFHRAQAP